MSATYGDDLEVNYALSDEEDASEDSGPEGELVAEPALRLFAREPAAAAPAKAAGKGKKRTAWDEEEAGIDAAAEERRAKKRQRLDKLKEKAKSERAAARGKRPAGPPVGGSSAEQREFLWEFVLRQVGSELSSLERDAKPPGARCAATHSCTRARVAQRAQRRVVLCGPGCHRPARQLRGLDQARPAKLVHAAEPAQ